MGERPPPDPLRFATTANIASSTGWTDEKHMLYITSLEECFVNQLYNGELDSKRLFCQSPEENSIACYMDYGTSTNFPQQEKTSNYAKEKGSGRFAASYLQWHGHSLPRTESSGQNFIDGETEGTSEHSRGCREKRHKQKAGSASFSQEGQGRPKQWSM